MHRVLFVVPVGGGLPIFGYGLFLMLGFVLGLLIACRRGERLGLKRDAILDVGLIAIFTGVVGARLAFLLVDYQPLDGDSWRQWFAVWQGGLTFQGGLVFAAAAAWLYLRARRISVGTMLDAYAPGLSVGVASGRIGCLLNGCCWGGIAPAGFPGGIVFPSDIEPMAVQSHWAENWPDYWNELTAGLGYAAATPPPLPLYPTQIISAIGLLAIAVALVVLERLRPDRAPGQVMLWFLFLYSSGRFLIEFWRDDTPLRYGVGAFPGLRLGQWLALAGLLVGVVFQIALNRRKRGA